MGKWFEYTLHRYTEKQTKRCTMSLVIREMQIKTIMWYHYSPSKWAKIKNTDHAKCWQECEGTKTLLLCWEECELVQPHRRTVWQFLEKSILISQFIASLFPLLVSIRLSLNSSSYCWIVAHPVSHTVYPFTCWWTFEGVPSFDYYK